MRRLLLPLTLLLLFGCENPQSDDDGTCPPGGCVDPKDAGGSGDTGSDAGSADVPSLITSLTITPTAAVLLAIDGVMPSQVFRVTAVFNDGRSEEVSGLANWTIDPMVLGTFDRATSTFTANGRFGGAGLLVAEFAGVEAEATVRVVLEQTIIVVGTSTDAPMRFLPPPVIDPAREAQLVYPLEGAVMPQNVPPADIQWLRSAPGDVFRVRLRKPNVLITAFISQTVPDFRNNWLVDLGVWRSIAQSEPVEWSEITVDRYEAASGEWIAGVPLTIRFPKAALLGSIYYWDIVRGRIVRINDGTIMRDEFLPSPPLGCVGCHSVSNSGRWMAGRFGGGENVGGVFDLTEDLTGATPPLVWPVTSTTTHWWFSDWSPDDSRMVVTMNEQGASRGLFILDPFNGRVVDPLGGVLPTGGVTHPDWAPDGSAIAYIGDAETWGGANTIGNIYLLPVLGQDQFGDPSLVLSGTTPPGLPLGASSSYPSWSPDSQWIAFAHGTSSRSENGQSALYLMKRDGTGLVRLDNASGGTDGVVSFQPRFSPFIQDGYFWLSFLSRRDYGNSLAGTAGSSRQQIWVTAIRVNAPPGEEPSQVPYWLPGQNTQSLNISAYWAPRACRDEHEVCGVDAECCSGECALDPLGTPFCAPMSTECRELGELCTANEQCCNSVLCIDGTCGNL